MARRDDLLHPLEIALLICADHEEGSLDAVLVKDLQNFIRPRRGTVVKGQVDGVVHVHGAAQRIVGVQLGVKLCVGGDLGRRRLRLDRRGLAALGRGRRKLLLHGCQLAACRVELPVQAANLREEVDGQRGGNEDQQQRHG